MTSVEAAKKIIAQGGRCDGVSCRLDSCPGNDRHPCVIHWGWGGKSSQEARPNKLAWFKRWLSEHGEEGGESKEGKPVERFEVGKWYTWVGPKERQDFWNGAGLMDGVLDGKPHLCTKSTGPQDANFDCAPRDESDWSWRDGFQHFLEVPPPPEGEAGRQSPIKTGVLVNVKIGSTECDPAPWVDVWFRQYDPKIGASDSLVSQRQRIRASLISRI